MLNLRRVFSMTEFLRNHWEMVAMLAESRQPVVLTVKGKPSLVIQDAVRYQELLYRLSQAEAAGGEG
jgi:PHD/YefM family antitoxin component YafN of YafNO toxin-antitoxin module